LQTLPFLRTLRPRKHPQCATSFSQPSPPSASSLSATCHILGWLRLDPPLGQATLLLHIGLFPLWIPLVNLANRTMPKKGRNNMQHLLAELPPWISRLAGAISLYALIRFAWFLYLTSQYPKGKVPF
jgi:hypothetical protein